MKLNRKCFVSFFACLLFFCHSKLLASHIEILNQNDAQKASYVSSEYNFSLPYWIIEGKLFDLVSAKNLIKNENKIGCTIWLMNFSENLQIPKENIQKILLVSGKQIPIWKIVNGKQIFVDSESSLALSYNCVATNKDHEIEEIESLPVDLFNQVFSNILKITEQTTY